MRSRCPISSLFPYTTLFRSDFGDGDTSSQQSPTHIFTTPGIYTVQLTISFNGGCVQTVSNFSTFHILGAEAGLDRKSTRLNSSHLVISYAVFCLKKKTRLQIDVPIIITERINEFLEECILITVHSFIQVRLAVRVRTKSTASSIASRRIREILSD